MVLLLFRPSQMPLVILISYFTPRDSAKALPAQGLSSWTFAARLRLSGLGHLEQHNAKYNPGLCRRKRWKMV